MAEIISSHRELKAFFDSKSGKALLEEHSLRRSKGPVQRIMEAIGVGGIAVHKKGSAGTLAPLGEIHFEQVDERSKPMLVVFHDKPREHPERKDLAKFVKALGTRFGLGITYKRQFTFEDDTEE